MPSSTSYFTSTKVQILVQKYKYLLEVEDQGGHAELNEHVRRVSRDTVGAFDGRQRGGERRKLPAGVSICTLVLAKHVN